MKTSKTIIQSIVFIIISCWTASSANAQILYTVSGDQKIEGGNGSTTVRPNLEVTGTGGVLFGGTLDQGSNHVIGYGPKMMWYPKKAAFWAGLLDSSIESTYSYLDNPGLNDAYIGYYSFASGYNSLAAGEGSVAMGIFAFSSGYSSVALGYSNASGDYSVALGNSFSDGAFSLSTGNSVAHAEESAAMGMFLISGAYRSAVIGSGNVWDSTQNTTEWVATEDLFVVGNGQDWENTSNALVLRKNANMRTGGNLETKGVIRCAPGGDLSMGSFTAGQNPATLNTGLKYSGE